MRIIGGIEPATRGTVLLDGTPVVTDQWHERKVGVVFQEDRLLPWMSLHDNVALVLKPLGVDRTRRGLPPRAAPRPPRAASVRIREHAASLPRNLTRSKLMAAA